MDFCKEENITELFEPVFEVMGCVQCRTENLFGEIVVVPTDGGASAQASGDS